MQNMRTRFQYAEYALPTLLMAPRASAAAAAAESGRRLPQDPRVLAVGATGEGPPAPRASLAEAAGEAAGQAPAGQQAQQAAAAMPRCLLVRRGRGTLVAPASPAPAVGFAPRVA